MKSKTCHFELVIKCIELTHLSVVIMQSDFFSDFILSEMNFGIKCIELNALSLITMQSS